MSVRAAQNRDVEHARHFNVADVQHLAGYFLVRVFAINRMSDDYKIRHHFSFARFLKNFVGRLLKNISEARRAKDRSFGCRSGQAPHPSPVGWVERSDTHRLVRWSEAIERNEAYECFSAAC